MNASFGTEEFLRPVLRWRSTPSGVVQAVVMHALQLRRPFREVFILCDIQGCSITEAAVLLDQTPEMVIQRLKHARGQMQGVLNRLCEPTDCLEPFC